MLESIMKERVIDRDGDVVTQMFGYYDNECYKRESVVEAIKLIASTMGPEDLYALAYMLFKVADDDVSNALNQSHMWYHKE